MAYTTLTYRVSFTTPAFLGNAEQSGRWRTPPVNNLDAGKAREHLS
jgi:hypothetical protein